MTTIEQRDDVYQLVSAFYDRIKVHERLGPIFLSSLPTDEIWNAHLIQLTDFWESNLFGVIRYQGNLMKAHQEVDRSMDYGLSQDDFYQWLSLWNSTIDEMFEGEKAELAKEKARRMSTHLYVDVWKNKPDIPTE